MKMPESQLHANSLPASKEASSAEDHRERTTLEQVILQRLDQEKASDLLFIDVTGRSAIADSLVVASGRSKRHVGAMADHVLRALKDRGFGRARVEGLPHCDWVLIDAGDVIVHLFRPEVRAFYNIEKIWSVGASDQTVAT